MFSEELRILDHNTAEYMVDVMQNEIDSQRSEIVALKQQNGGQQDEIASLKQQNEGQQETIGSLQEEIAYLKAQLEVLK